MNLYEQIVEKQTELICRFLPDGTLTYVNQAYCDYFNKKRSDLVGKSFMPMIPEEDQPKAAANLAGITPENPVSSVQHRVILDNGDVRWQEWTDTFLYDENDNFIEGQAVGRDITEQKELELALVDTTQLFEAFYNDAPLMMAIVGFDGSATRMNTRICDVLGYTPSEMKTVTLEARYVAEDLLKRNAIWGELVEQGGAQTCELRMLTKAGDIRLTEWRFTADQSSQRIYCIGEDVTEQRAMQTQIRMQDLQFRQIVEAMPDAIVYANPERNIMLVNPSFTRIFGYAPDDVLGLPTQVLYTDPEAFIKTGAQRFNPTSAVNYDAVPIEFRRKSGEDFLGEMIGVRIMDADGSVIGYLGIIRDITKRVRLQQELQDLNDQLELRVEDRTQEIRDLVHKITHDFRAPIRAINNYVSFIEEDYSAELDETGISFLTAIRENTSYVGSLVQDLLDYYKIRYNQSYTFAPVNLQQQISAIVRRSDSNTLGTITVAEQWPSVYANASLLGQALSNLLDNAVKYKAAGRPVEVTIRPQNTDTHWGIQVADNGIGIAEQYLEKIFGKFERLHTQQEYDGTGIGLAIVQSVADVHGGKVDVASKLGEGSTFTLYLSKDLK